MRTLIRQAQGLVLLIGLHLLTAVASAQDTPAGRVVTTADWQLRLPVIGLIVVFTLLVTGVFFYYAARNLRRSTPRL